MPLAPPSPVVLTIGACIVEGSRPIISLTEFHAANCVAVFSSVPGLGSFALLPGAGAIPLWQNQDGDTMLSLVPFPSTDGLPSWTPFDADNPAHRDLPAWDVIMDTGAQMSCFGEEDAHRLLPAPLTRHASVIAVGGLRPAVTGAGTLRLVVPPDPVRAARYVSSLASSLGPRAYGGAPTRPAARTPHVFRLERPPPPATSLAAPLAIWPPGGCDDSTPPYPTPLRDEAGRLLAQERVAGHSASAGPAQRHATRDSSCATAVASLCVLKLCSYSRLVRHLRAHRPRTRLVRHLRAHRPRSRLVRHLRVHRPRTRLVRHLRVHRPRRRLVRHLRVHRPRSRLVRHLRVHRPRTRAPALRPHRPSQPPMTRRDTICWPYRRP